MANLAAGIAQCKRLLEFGGLGHTCAIHSQNDAAIREFGAAVPAFRVIVNTSAVHGSIGYSTNLFPAMTLGCGAPGGNITSDNIGPQHLINVKRIAWESRRVEHRTVPAEDRMAGTARASASASEHAAAATAAGARGSAAAPAAKPAKAEPSAPATAPPADVAERAEIAAIVGEALAARGIERGGGVAPAEAVAGEPSPAAIASEIAVRVFGAASATGSGMGRVQPAEEAATAAAGVAQALEAAPAAPSARPAVVIVPFVSENDVRRAMTRGEKIFIGRKTILTPSAHDLGFEHEVFVETEGEGRRG